MSNLDELNQYLDDFVGDEEEEEYTFVLQLIDIILSGQSMIKPKKYHSCMDRKYAQKYSYQFLKELDSRYADYLEEYLASGKLVIYPKSFRPRQLSMMYPKGEEKYIDFYETGTIEDSYTYSHEIMHAWNLDVNHYTANWHLTTEAFSILTEMLQEDFYRKKLFFKRLSVKQKRYF